MNKTNKPASNNYWRKLNSIHHKNMAAKYGPRGKPLNPVMHEPYASDEPTTDIHATDPARLEKEVKKDLGVKDSSDTINNPRPNPDPIEGIQDSRDKYMKGRK
jgi:hypothetical protein